MDLRIGVAGAGRRGPVGGARAVPAGRRPDTDLTGAQLEDANLGSAQFHRATLTHAQLLRADLTRACLDGDFAGACLFGAVLTNAWLQRADLRDAEGLSVEQVVVACPTSITQLPPDLAADPQVADRVAAVSARGMQWSVVTVSVAFTPRTARGRRQADDGSVLAFRRNAIETGPGMGGGRDSLDGP